MTEPRPDLIPAWVDDQLTPVDKLRAHQEGLRHKAVSIFVVQGRQILMQRRALAKYHTPGLWANSCCTHPLWDEPSEVCALRRLREELGIQGLEPEYRQTLEYRADVGGGLIEHEVVDVYLAHVRAPLELSPNPAEVMETRWMGYDDLLAEVHQHPERFTPWLKIYLADHADVIFDTDLLSPDSL